MTSKHVTGAVVGLALLAASCGADGSESTATGSTSTTQVDGAAVETTAQPATSSAASEATTTTEQVVEEPTDQDDSAGTATAEPTFAEDFPDIIAAQATREDAGTWRFDVTVSSPYDTPQRYADAWRVLDQDGNELGIRVLTHDHANEQPFTRSQTGIEIPDDVTEVTVQGRDLSNGWGGGELTVTLPAS